MSLHRVGLCGVDDSVDPSLLSAIVSRWPRVELGVLFRPGKEGQPRFPTRRWLEQLAKTARNTSPPAQLAGHLCGSAVDDVLQRGDVAFVQTLVGLGFRRVQLNATAPNGCKTAEDPSLLAKAAQQVRKACSLVPEVEFIVQANDETAPLWRALLDEPPANLSLLWDASCGRGKTLDASMITVETSIPQGFAGGLNRDNVATVLDQLRKGAARGRSIWIDMESGLRSYIDGSERFDVNRAWAVCAALGAIGWDDPDAPSPSPVTYDLPPQTTLIKHALAAHKVTLLRDRRTKPRDFRGLLRELSSYVGYEATRSLSTVPRHDCVTPRGVHVPADGRATRLAARCALVPIMRAGLGMVESMQALLPNAAVHQIGMFKRSGSDRPVEYYSRLPKHGGDSCDIAFILDPVVATAKTMTPVIAKLKAWGAHRIVACTVLASAAVWKSTSASGRGRAGSVERSAEGLRALHEAHPDVEVYAIQVDGRLARDGGLLPGLGDAGDRLFGATGVLSAKDIVANEALEKQLALGATYAWEEAGARPTRPRRPRADSAESLTRVRSEPSTLILGDVSGNTGEIPAPSSAEETATQLTTHDGSFGPDPCRMRWGATTPSDRGPVLATTRHTTQRNAIGAHAGGYSVYRALAVAAGKIDRDALPQLGLTTPAAKIGPHEAWRNSDAIVTMDPWGHAISEGFGAWLDKGYDVRPTIAITKAHVQLPECLEALRMSRLTPDGTVLTDDGTSVVTKAAIEPVWYLPGVAKRFGVSERVLRDALFAETNSMYPELISRDDLKIFLPPIGGMTAPARVEVILRAYIWGDASKIEDEDVELTVRVHDECNGSDVFGSDICTCRPYLTHAIEECIKTAQRGGTGVVVYFRKEGRALGEVTKYLVYNMRKRQEGGDKAKEYFNCTQSVAGVQDTRFQALMPDVLHWLGITKIHNFISMSDMKCVVHVREVLHAAGTPSTRPLPRRYNAIVESGIEIVNRVEIPPEMVPKDAQVEIAAKVFHGYHAGAGYAGMDEKRLDGVVGREYVPDPSAQRVA